MIAACDSQNSYIIEEDKAVEDVINSYITYYIEKANLLPTHDKFDSAVLQRDLNRQHIQVYISDALMPISQIFEDDEWMKNSHYENADLQSLFSQLYKSEEFKQLEYREFEKEKIRLVKPLNQCVECADKLSADEQYSRISLSRICFNENRDKGLVVIEYGIGYEHTKMSGYHGAFLIEKNKGKWEIIPN